MTVLHGVSYDSLMVTVLLFSPFLCVMPWRKATCQGEMVWCTSLYKTLK